MHAASKHLELNPDSVWTPRLTWLPILCAWLLMATTLSPPDRHAVIFGSVDLFAAFKAGVRVLVVVLLCCGGFYWWQYRGKLQPAYLLLPCLLFAGWGILSTAWSPLITVSLWQSSSLFTLLLLAAAFALFTRDIEDVSRILRHVIWGLMILSCVALFCYYCLPQTHALERSAVDGLLHPTNAAATAALGLVLLVGSWLIWRWPWSTILLLPGTCVFTWLLLLAMNRTSLIVTFIVLSALFVRFAGRTLTCSVLLLGSILGTIYLIADPGMTMASTTADTVVERATRDQSAKQLMAFSGREELWEIMWDSFCQSPWMGHGYFVTTAEGRVAVWNLKANVTAHNFVLQILVTTGCVGLVFVLLAAFFVAPRLWHRLVRSQRNRPYATFCLLLGCWYLGWGLTNSSVAGPLQPESIVFFTLLGLACGLAEGTVEREAATPMPTKDSP